MQQFEEIEDFSDGFAGGDYADYDDGNIGDFEIRDGVAVPTDEVEEINFRNMQRAINAYLAAFLPSAPRLRIDGRIGRTTVTALNASFVHGSQTGRLPGLSSQFTIDSAASGAVPNAQLLNKAVGKATGAADDSRIAPPRDATPARPPTTPAPPVSPSDPKGKGTGTVLAIVGAVAAGGLVLFLLARRKKNKVEEI